MTEAPKVEFDDALDFGESGDFERIVDLLRAPLSKRFNDALKGWSRQMFEESYLCIKPNDLGEWVVAFTGWNMSDAQVHVEWPLDRLLGNLWLCDGGPEDAARLAKEFRTTAERIEAKLKPPKSTS